MKIELFVKELHVALVARGINSENAKKHVVSLYRSFTPDDIKEIEAIQSSEEINKLADNIAGIVKKNAAQAHKTAEEKIAGRENQRGTVSKSDSRSSHGGPNDSDVFEKFEHEPEPTSRGLMIFWGGLVLTLPITLFLLGTVFGAFAVAFLGLIALIVGGIALLAAIVAAGAGASLIGIIYGVTQLFSFPAVGIYEIGLGIIVAGVVLLSAVLIYNISIHYIPRVISYLAVFFKYVCGKLKLLFIFARKECYKL